MEQANSAPEIYGNTQVPAETPSQPGPAQFGEQPAVETVTLRKASAADAATLAVVASATFLEAYTWALPGADIIDFCIRHHTTQAYAAYLARPDTRITLAVTGRDAPVGYAMVCTPDFPDFDVLPTDTELKRIYLFSRFRGSGVAQQLLAAAEHDARTLGRTRLLLGTHAGNARAIAFYRRNGFSDVGERVFEVGAQRCHDLIFGKSL